MGLMFARVARNFAKAGYFPTDEPTLARVLTALEPANGMICVIDPCAGEGAAIAEIAHDLGRDRVRTYAVEYDRERAAQARLLVDRCLHADLMDTFISRQAFGLLFLNPPYGDLMSAHHDFKGRARLEKLFYQRSLPYLQHDGVLVFIIPIYVVDAELVGWLTRHFVDLRAYRAVETKFKQVVIFGRRSRGQDRDSDQAEVIRQLLLQAGRGDVELEELPEQWPLSPYLIPASMQVPEHFYRVSMEPSQVCAEITRLQGLWPDFDTHLGAAQQLPRPPARALSRWHLAIALAAGAISGIVRSKTGRVLVVRGDTHKEQSETTEFNEEDGEVIETRVLTDRFIPVIRAWDMTPESATFGQVITIR